MQIQGEPGKKSLHKPELVGQITHIKRKLNKTKKTKEGVNLRGAEGKNTAQARVGEVKHAKQKITGAEGIALHKQRCL